MAGKESKGAFVSSKTQEIVEQVSKATGVKSDAVQKILSSLGLETALSNRVEMPTGIRVAASQIAR